jgi:ABC-type glutathione transport system ATPase component
MEANAVFVDDGCTTKPFLVILDEYCDKDVTAVTSVFLRGLKTLCSALGDGSPGQIFVITHSKKVASMCDNLVVLKDGRLWSQGSPSRVLQNLPSNMIVLD